MADYENAVLEPHLMDMSRGSTRYPNPYFDLGQQYTPRTVKELFRWCSFFYYSTPLVGATITKISRYPITDLIIEDPDTRIKKVWEDIFLNHIKIKERLMEVNLDLNVYGNALVSLHLPFTRLLVCQSCGQRTDIKDTKWTWKSYAFSYTCPKCGSSQVGDPEKPETIKDIPYRSKEDIQVVRWNPENISLRYSEATGRTTYYYTLSSALRYQITTGERDVLEDMPLLFILSVKKSRIIKLANKNIFHLKRPTLAEKDMGWGKPLVYHVLKDLYYLATLRKAQEAIANEHIVPFDFLYPTPNANMDPFVHSDLGSWRTKVEDAIKRHRQDPNYKAVLPVPLGFGRLGGDGKAMMLTPELNYLNQTIVGGMGIPQEFLFGGLNWTGSSVTLRSLQNDFLHNQSQLLDLTNWMKKKIQLFLKIPGAKKVRFLDFKMADDIQRIQQLIGLNAQRKVSDETLLTELGLDYEKETKKIIEEIQVQNKIQDLMAKSQSKTSGEAQIISYNYQQKIQELQQKLLDKQNANTPPGQNEFAPQTAPGMSNEQSGLVPQQLPPGQEGQVAQTTQSQNTMAPGYQDQTGQDMAGAGPSMSEGGQAQYLDIHKTIKTWASKLSKMEPGEQMRMLAQIKQQMPAFGQEVEKALQMELAQSAPGAAGGGSAGQSNPTGTQVNMNAMPEKGAPTRAGSY